MPRYTYGGPLFVAQGKRLDDALGKTMRDEALKREYVDLYRITVRNLRETYGINHGMPNYGAQLLVDEIALSTVRIQRMEQWLNEVCTESGKWNGEMEKANIALKQQRGRTLERLVYLTGGKREAGLRAGKMSYREKMNRSKKLQQVQTIEKTVKDDEIKEGKLDGVGVDQGTKGQPIEQEEMGA